MKVHRVKEGNHGGRDTSIPGLPGWRLVNFKHRLEQGEHPGSVILGLGGTREIPRMLGTEV